MLDFGTMLMVKRTKNITLQLFLAGIIWQEITLASIFLSGKA
jgi:hypothetical protein